MSSSSASTALSTTLPDPEVLVSWATVVPAIEWAGVKEHEWKAFAKAAGDEELTDISLFASMDDADFSQARNEAGLPLIRKAALNKMFAAVKAKYGLATSIAPRTITTLATVDAPKDSMVMDMPKLQAKVKLGQIPNQSMDQDIPMLPPNLITEYRGNYITICGDEPLPAIDPSDAQLTALHFAVTNGLAPYADFAIFGPHGTRSERRMRFVQHFMDASGVWRTSEQPGPPTIEQWRASWETFAAAALMLKIASAATLSRYSKRFEERCARYPRAWHICVTAEDRCRCEFLAAEKRRQERFHNEHPGVSAYDHQAPWNTVLKEATENSEYWTRELAEPALIYTTTRGTQAPSWNTQKFPEGEVQRPKRDRPESEEQRHPIHRSGVYITDAQGRELCINYNQGRCVMRNCRRSHKCEVCLGNHRSNDKSCGHGAKGAKAGNKYRRGSKGTGKGKQNAKPSTDS